jgi:hypothetical protein
LNPFLHQFEVCRRSEEEAVLTVSEPAFLATRSWYEAIPNSASDIGSKRCKRVFLLKRLSLLRSGIWIERGMKFTAGGGQSSAGLGVSVGLATNWGKSHQATGRLVQVRPTLTLTEINIPKENFCYSMTFCTKLYARILEVYRVSPAYYSSRQLDANY